MDTPPETPDKKPKTPPSGDTAPNNPEDTGGTASSDPKTDQDAATEENAKSTPPVTVVMSKLEAELAAERARVEADLALARANRKKVTTKKVVTIVLVVAGSLALFGTLAYFLATTISGQYRPGSSDPNDEDPSQDHIYATIEGYKCTTKNCFKATDLTDTTILVRDEAYYVHNRETGANQKTTIDSIDFRSFTPFHWGESLLIVLERATGRQGLYSISDNRPLTTSYNYTEFYRDINADLYKDMKWIEGRYILASAPPEVRLIDIKTGNELVRASVKIYVDHDFIIGYEPEGQRRAYTLTGTRLFVVDAPSTILVYDHHIFHMTAEKTFNLYDSAGTKLKNSDEYYKNIRTQLQATKLPYADALRNLGALTIPD